MLHQNSTLPAAHKEHVEMRLFTTTTLISNSALRNSEFCYSMVSVMELTCLADSCSLVVVCLGLFYPTA